MSYPTKMILPFAGMVLLAVIVTGAVSQYSSAQTPSAPELGDLRAATLVEIHGPQGSVLNGEFRKEEKSDGSYDLVARLSGTGVQDGGEVEIEIPSSADKDQRQELEVELQGLTPRQAFTVHIDGREVTSVTTDGRGAADVELKAAAAGR